MLEPVTDVLEPVTQLVEPMLEPVTDALTPILEPVDLLEPVVDVLTPNHGLRRETAHSSSRAEPTHCPNARRPSSRSQRVG